MRTKFYVILNYDKFNNREWAIIVLSGNEIQRRTRWFLIPASKEDLLFSVEQARKDLTRYIKTLPIGINPKNISELLGVNL
jgi:hypothetical protein